MKHTIPLTKITFNDKTLVVLVGLGVGASVLLLTRLVYSEYSVEDLPHPHYWLTVLIGLAGIPIGGLIGSAASPQDESENAKFKAYAGLVATFVSGYLLSHIQGLLDGTFKEGLLTANVEYGLRVLVFSLFLVGSAIHFYVYRTYVRDEDFRQRAASLKAWLADTSPLLEQIVVLVKNGALSSDEVSALKQKLLRSPG